MATRAVSPLNDLEMSDVSAPAEPSALSAAERAVEAAQRIAIERVELLRLEAEEALGRLAMRAGLILAAGFIAILGWCGLAVALVVVLAERMPLAASIAMVGGAHVLIGIGLVIAAAALSGRKKT